MPVNRITFLSQTRTTTNRLMTRSAEMNRANQQLASGRQFERASDDPAKANRAQTLRAQIARIDSYERTSADSKGRLDAADVRLGQAMDGMHRIKELVTQASSSTVNAEGRQAVVQELTQLRDSMVQIANSRYLDDPLFAGFQSADPVANVAGTWTFTGTSAETLVRKVSDNDRVQVNVTASDTFQFGGDNTFQMIDDIIAAVQSGNTTAVAATQTRVDLARTQLSGAQSRIGAAANRIDAVTDRNSALNVALRAELAQVEDIDLEEAITEVSRQQAAYQAALGAAARSIQPSLVDFLR